MREFILSIHSKLGLSLVIANAGVSEGTVDALFDLAKGATQVTAINVNGVHNTVLPAIEAMRSTGSKG